MQSFDIFFYIMRNNLLNKLSSCLLFGRHDAHLIRHDAHVMLLQSLRHLDKPVDKQTQCKVTLDLCLL